VAARRFAASAVAASLVASLYPPALAFAQDRSRPVEPREVSRAATASPAAVASERTGGRPALVDATLLWVIDGDTVCARIEGRVERVRYIGIDAPETRHSPRGGEPGGEEASEANRRLVEGQPLQLELDVAPRDRYGRVLAYVYAGERLVNAELVRQGYARTSTVPPNVKYKRLLRRLQHEARDQRRGLWAAATAERVSGQPAPGSAAPGGRGRPARPRCR
jgi:endonuclease YncB( thermonuclease family)